MLSDDIDMSLFGLDVALSEETEKKNKKVEFEVKKQNKVIVECISARQAEDLYERLVMEGYTCTKRIV